MVIAEISLFTLVNLNKTSIDRLACLDLLVNLESLDPSVQKEGTEFLVPLAQKEHKARRAKQALLEYKGHRAKTECT